MDKKTENFEPGKNAQQYDVELYRNFHNELNEKNTSELPRKSTLANKWQGDIGEGVALRIASEKLGLIPDPDFDQPPHGFDGLYRDAKGQLVIVESKLSDKGIHSLENGQMQPEWIEKNAKLMQDPDSEQYSSGNSKLGQEIICTGTGKIRRFVIASDPKKLEAKIYEGQSDRSWKHISTFNILDIDQPILDKR
jgi:hypothetical protein